MATDVLRQPGVVGGPRVSCKAQQPTENINQSLKASLSQVVLMTPGEVPIASAINSRGYTFLDNTTMTGMYAQAIGAATVVIERASFGPLCLICAK